MWKLKVDKKDNLILNYRIMIAASCLIQLLCFIVFVCWGVVTMIPFFAIAIILHITFFFMVINPKWINFCLVSLFAEDVLFTALCNLLIGYGFGFSIYAVALVPMCFFNSYLEKNIFMPFASSLLFSVSDFIIVGTSIIFSSYDTGVINDNHVSMGVFFLGNFILGIIFMAIYSSRYYKIMKRSDENIEKKNEELYRLAHFDNLTGLRNRNEMENDIKTISGDFCTIIGDIDKFKKINDTYGHFSGDKVLMEVAHIIKANFADDLVYRFGGEEFLLVVKGNKEEVTCRVEKLRKEIESKEIILSNKTIHVTMTFGVSSNVEEENTEKMIILADDRTYVGKNQGRNQVVSC